MTCYNNLQVAVSYRNKQQGVYRFVTEVTTEVTAQLVTGTSQKIQPAASSYSKLHEAFIKKEGHLSRYFSRDLLKI